MKKTLAATALAAGIITGAGVALTVPGIALAADSGSTGSTSATATDRAAARLAAIKDALKGLVTDGTITQAQADKVATTLSQADMPFGRGPGGPGGPGRGGPLSPEATAKVLGITVDELRTAMMSGKTLTQVAAAQGISKADLISKLVTAAKTQLAADLKAGKITQAQYDACVADLQAHITERVDQVGPGRPGPGGPGDLPPAPASTTTATPGATA